MSDAPDNQFIDTPDIVFVLSATAGTLRNKPRYGHCTEYRRTDLPPTREQIMADPRVMALVEALKIVANGDSKDYTDNYKLAATVLAALTDNEGGTE